MEEKPRFQGGGSVREYKNISCWGEDLVEKSESSPGGVLEMGNDGWWRQRISVGGFEQGKIRSSWAAGSIRGHGGGSEVESGIQRLRTRAGSRLKGGACETCMVVSRRQWSDLKVLEVRENGGMKVRRAEIVKGIGGGNA